MSIFIRLFLFVLLFSSSIVYGQVYQYTTAVGTGSLQVEILGSNPCFNGASLEGGYIEFRVLSTVDGQAARLNTIIKQGGGGPNYFLSASIPVGTSFIFFANNSGVPSGSFNPTSAALPVGSYDFYIEDFLGTEFINSFSANPITLVQFSDIVINEDLVQNNSDCSLPLDGQIVASVSGGSLSLIGGTPPPAEQTSPESSFTYTWTSDNGLPALTPNLVGNWDGTTPLNLATLLGAPGLPGGTYTLRIDDDFSACFETRQFTITDPTPAVQNVIAPYTKTICSGQNITIQLANSEVGVTYGIYRNGASTPLFTFPGGGSPFTMTFSSAAFNSGDFIVIQGVDGFCTPVAMDRTVNVAINPLPTASISGTNTICAGGSATLTFALPVGTYNVVYTDGTTNFNANGISNGATVSVSPGTNRTYTIVSVSNTATTCSVTAPSANITGSAVITVNPLPTASISGTNTICSGGTAVLTFTLSAGTYNVVYTDGTTNFNANGISSGATVNVVPGANTTYTIVSVSNTATTCSTTAPSANITGSAVITVNPLPTASISGTTTICSGASATLTFTLSAGTYNVVYTNGTTNFNANGISSGATVSVSPVANATYTIVSITNTTIASCTVTAPSANITGSAVVTVNPSPTASISGTSTVCLGGSATLTFTLPVGTYNVVYTDGTTNFNANGISNGATVSVSPGTTRTYTIVSVSNLATSCSSTAPSTNITGSAVITVNPLPTASISGTATICSGGTTALTFTLSAGTYNVVYTDGTTNFNANGITSGATANVSPTANTTYTIVSVTNTLMASCTVTAPNPNITGNAIITINSPIASISGSNTICSGGSTPITFTLPAGTYDVVYTNGTVNFNANAIVSGATVSVSPLINTTYTIVSVTNTITSCSVSAPSPNITGSAVITITSGPVLVSPQSKTICTGETVGYEILLNPANLPAGTMFSWPDPDGAGPATAGTNVPMGAAGTLHINDLLTNTTAAAITVSYTVTPSLVGCSGAAVPIDITVLPEPTISGILVGSICAGSSTADLIYDTTTGSPDQLNIDFDDPSFTDITNLPLTASPISFPVLATATPNTYTATLTVFNSSSGCFSTGIPISLTIVGLPIPTVTGPTEVCENSTGNVYTTETGKTNYVWTVSGNGTVTAGGGLTDNTVTITWAGLVPQSVSVNYTQNTCSAATPGTLAVNVNPTPTITGVAIAPICTGVTPASLTYGAVTGSPDEYSIDFDGAAEIAGFVDVINASLPISPISIVIPGTTAAGTYNASFTVRNSVSGCSSAATPINITLTPSPTATMTGTTAICGSAPTNITVNFTGTGPWSFQYWDGTTTSPPIPSFFNCISFSVSPSITTTYEITLIKDATVCDGPIGSSATVTVNQPPLANLPVGVALSPICSGGITDVTVSNSEVGVSYQLRNDAGDIPVGTPVIGTGALISLSTGPLLANQTFNILATATGCAPVQLANLANVTVTGSINAALTVTAVPNPICEGSSTNIQISNSENGVLYQLRDDSDNSVVGGTVAGNGSTIDLATGVLSNTTAYNVLASNGTCSIELTDVETVVVNVNPDPALAVAVTLDPICVGGTSAVTVALSETGVNYQLRTEPGNVDVGTAVAGTGGTITLPTGTLNASTTFNILATSGVCTAVKMTTLATINVSGTIDATLTVTATASPICEGASTIIQVANSENGISYQLRDGNVPIGVAVVGTGSTIDLPVASLTTTTTFNVLASNGTCSIQLTDTQIVDVDAAPNAGLAVSTTLNPLCTGGVSAVTVALSQVGVNYQLRNDADDSDIGLPVAGTGGMISLSTGVLNATTTFNVLATSGVCSSVELTQTVTITVAGTINAGLTVDSSFSPICEGASTFIQVQLSEVGVNYQLRDGNDINVGTSVAGNGGTINLPTGNLSTTTVFNVVGSNSACSIQLTDTETITVNPAPDVTLAVAPASGLICSGTATNIVVTASESGVTYQLRNNTGNVAIGAAVVSSGGNLVLPTGSLTTSTTFNVFATLGGCSSQLTTTASVAIRPIGDPACGPGGGGSDCANFSAIIPTIVTQPSCNDRDAGEVSFTISRSNGTPTTFRVIWTYDGTNQTKFTAGTVSFDDLNSGLYTYTIIDEGNGRTCGPVDFFLDLKTQVEILDKEVLSTVSCFDGTDGNVKLTVDGTTTGEYWYKYVLDGQESVAQTFTPGAPLPGGLPADDNDFIIIKVDETFAFSCPDTVMVRIKHAFPKIDFTVASTEVTTCNGTDGAVQVSGATGGNTTSSGLQVRLKKEVPFSTDPSGYIVVSDFENLVSGALEYTDLAQGNYIVDVKDQIDCIQSKPIAIQAPGQVPLSLVDIIPTDASCANEGASGSIQVTINQAGIYEVAVSQDQVNVPEDDEFVQYNSPSLPSVTFNNLIRGRYFLYIKSNITECPTRSDVINIGGVYAVGDFDIISNCENINLTLNNITGERDSPFVIRVFSNDDKFFKIDSLRASVIPQSNSISFIYNAPLQHSFLTEQGTYRFVMIQTQTTGAGTCTLVSDTVVYDVRQQVGIVLGKVTPSFPDPKRTGSIELENILGGTRFVSGTNELYYEVSLTTADDDIVVFDWKQVKLNGQNKFTVLYEFLPPRVYRLKVRDASGCEKTQDIDVPLDPSVYVPNIFTPNDDEKNDEFEVLNLPLGGKHKLIISNRWGNQVFSSNDYREGNFWNAEGASDGVYYYRLKVEGGETFTGWVEVLRGTEP